MVLAVAELMVAKVWVLAPRVAGVAVSTFAESVSVVVIDVTEAFMVKVTVVFLVRVPIFQIPVLEV